jgi:predicted SAM-dependent methyltransferase
MKNDIERLFSFPARRILRKLIDKTPPRFRILVAGSIRLIVGADVTTQSGWIPTQASQLNLLNHADWTRLLRGRKVSAILSEHVWEHLSMEEGRLAAKTCFEFMKPGARIRVAVPDGHFPGIAYLEQVRPGGSGFGSDDHKVLYTIETLTETFEAAGFVVKPLEYFDKNGAFYTCEWDPADGGMIQRSSRYDERNQGGELRYTSIIIDAFKPSV